MAELKKRTVHLFEKIKNQPHDNLCKVEKISTFSTENSITVAEESMEKWFSLKQIWRKQGNEFREREVGYLAF